jgi:exonuclease SbcD
MRFIFVGDPHARGTNPRNRKDEYKPALIAKLREVFQLATDRSVDALLLAGDFFDLPDVANSVLNEFADVLSESPVPIYTTAGNHDIPGYNIVPKLHIINDPGKPVFFGRHDEVVITFTPYSGKIDHDGYGYSPEYVGPDGYKPYRIHVAHGMLLDHSPPFDRFTLVQEVKTSAHMVLTGHDHTGYGIYRRGDGVTFCNPGSLTRLSASESEISRTIQVALIEVQTSSGATLGDWQHQANIELLPLQSAKPGDEVLDRSRIEADQQRQYAMESFAALVQTSTGERVLLDIPTIVDTIAEQNGIPASVRELALAKIEEARMAAA